MKCRKNNVLNELKYPDAFSKSKTALYIGVTFVLIVQRNIKYNFLTPEESLVDVLNIL